MTRKTYVWWLRGDSHVEMARTSVASVAKCDPQANRLVVVDGDLDVQIEGAALARSDFRMLEMMPANVAAQCRIVLSADEGDDLWFLDADTLVLAPLVMPPADLAFTWRDHVGLNEDGEKIEGIAKRMPYNYGVVGVTASAASREAFLWLRERVRGYHIDYRRWYGNQFAQAELAGPPPQEGTKFVTRSIPWRFDEDPVSTVTIALLSCDGWNWTPPTEDALTAGRRVLHFKGHARERMDAYAKRLGLTA